MKCVLSIYYKLNKIDKKEFFILILCLKLYVNIGDNYRIKLVK